MKVLHMSQPHSSMEHRYGSRAIVFLDVTVRHPDGCVKRGRVQNVSQDGVFIQTILPDTQKGMIVDIEFAHGCCIRGWVAHTVAEGIGIMFVSSSGCIKNEQFTSLSGECLRCLKRIPGEGP